MANQDAEDAKNNHHHNVHDEYRADRNTFIKHFELD
jgi:hypothetical protein